MSGVELMRSFAPLVLAKERVRDAEPSPVMPGRERHEERREDGTGHTNLPREAPARLVAAWPPSLPCQARRPRRGLRPCDDEPTRGVAWS